MKVIFRYGNEFAPYLKNESCRKIVYSKESHSHRQSIAPQFDAVESRIREIHRMSFCTYFFRSTVSTTRKPSSSKRTVAVRPEKVFNNCPVALTAVGLDGCCGSSCPP